MTQDQQIRIRLSQTRVTHRNSQQRGWALEFNGSATDPAYWVEWTPDGGANWFRVDDVVQGWKP